MAFQETGIDGRRMKPHLSVVMVAGGDPEMTTAAVATLFANARMEYQLVIVDNGSPKDEKLGDVVRPILQTKDIFIRNEVGRSFARANNQALAVADGTFFLGINNDVLVEGDWQTPFLTEGVKYDLCGPTVRRLTICDELKSMRCHRVDGNKADAEPSEAGAYLEGWCFFIRTEYFRGLGGFDEAFWPMYCEDSDLSFRVKAAGGTLGKVPVPIRHIGQGNSKKYLTDDYRNALCEANNHRMYARWVKGAIL